MGGGQSSTVVNRPLVPVGCKPPTSNPLDFDKQSEIHVLWECYDDIENRWTPLHCSNAELLERAMHEGKAAATILLGPSRNLLFHVNLKSMKIEKTAKSIRRQLKPEQSEFTTLGLPPPGGTVSPTGQFREVRRLKQREKLYTGRLSPGGEMALIGGAERIIRLWKMTDSGSELSSANVEGQVLSVDFSSLHQVVAVSTDYNSMLVFDYAGGILDQRGKNTGEHTSRVYCVRFLRGEWAKQLITCDLTGLVSVWDIQTLEVIRRINPTVSAIYSMSAGDGSVFFAGCDDSAILVCDTRQPGTVQRLPGGHKATIWGVDYEVNGNGNRLVSCGMDQTCKVWDLRAMQVITSFQGHTNSVHHCCFTDKDRVCSVGRDHKAILWNATSGEVVGTLAHNHFVTHCHFDMESRQVITASFDRSAIIAGLE